MATLDIAPIAAEYMVPKPRGRTYSAPFVPDPKTLETVKTILASAGGISSSRPYPTALEALQTGKVALGYVSLVAESMGRGTPSVVVVDNAHVEYKSAKGAQTEGTAPFGYLIRLPGTKRTKKEAATS